MKKAVLLTLNYIIEVEGTELDNDMGLFDKIKNEVSKDIILECYGESVLTWKSTSTLVLDSKGINCGRCTNCGQWATDREKPNWEKGLTNGATIDGKLFCDECLPPDHRWAF